ncbi:unnamed protein product [Euphydryas editha]|uniref:Uncharacterized protein n=1 Tax=Euphydryas editha TaxID=104508 RepID=A0AAU9UJ39_EUPED|nr:unnamed protein product [Euphydryas editha]
MKEQFDEYTSSLVEVQRAKEGAREAVIYIKNEEQFDEFTSSLVEVQRAKEGAREAVNYIKRKNNSMSLLVR